MLLEKIQNSLLPWKTVLQQCWRVNSFYNTVKFSNSAAHDYNHKQAIDDIQPKDYIYATPLKGQRGNKLATQTIPRMIKHQNDLRFYTPEAIRHSPSFYESKEDIIEQLNILLECKRRNKDFVMPMAKYIADLATIYNQEENSFNTNENNIHGLLVKEEFYIKSYHRNIEYTIEKAQTKFHKLKNEIDKKFYETKNKLLSCTQENMALIRRNFGLLRQRLQARSQKKRKFTRPPLEKVIKDLLFITTEVELQDYMASNFPERKVDADIDRLTEAASKFEKNIQFDPHNSLLDFSRINEALEDYWSLIEQDLCEQLKKIYLIKPLEFEVKPQKAALNTKGAASSFGKNITHILKPSNTKMQLEISRSIYTNHSKTINCIVAINDRLVATGSNDHKINLYSLVNMDFIGALEGHNDEVKSLSLFKVSLEDLIATTPQAQTNKSNQTTLLVSGDGKQEGCILIWDISEFIEQTNKYPFHDKSSQELDSSILKNRKICFDYFF